MKKLASFFQEIFFMSEFSYNRLLLLEWIFIKNFEQGQKGGEEGLVKVY